MTELLVVALVVAIAGYGAYRFFTFAARAGAEYALINILAGAEGYCITADGKLPKDLDRLLGMKMPKGGRANLKRYMDHVHAIGEQLAIACSRGKVAPLETAAPAKGFVRIDLTEKELKDLWWLANMGFQRALLPREMIPRAYDGRAAAEAGHHAIEMLESRMPPGWSDPDNHRLSRRTSIQNKWGAK